LDFRSGTKKSDSAQKKTTLRDTATLVTTVDSEQDTVFELYNKPTLA